MVTLLWVVVAAFAIIVLFGDRLGLSGIRTILANGLVAIGMSVSAIFAFLADFQWGSLFRDNPEYAAAAVLIFSILNIVVRFKTTGPVGRK